MAGMTQDQLMKAAMQHQAALVTYAYARLRDYQLAEDVVQDSLLLIMKKWTDFKPGTNLFAWARQIVYYKVMEALRARKREITVEDQKLEAIMEKVCDTEFDEKWADRYRVMVFALEECMAQMNKKSVFLLRAFYRDCKSYHELAKMQSQTIEGIKKALYRCRKFLQECVPRRIKKAEMNG